MKPKSISELSNSNASSLYEPSEQSSICSMDDSSTEMAGIDSSATLASFTFPLDELHKKYKREFNAAIRKNYKYIMNEDIMDLCLKLTDSDNSASEDTCSSNNALSYHEFVKQYKDLSDRLQHLKEQLTNNKASSLSEKYLDKVYHEELLHRLTQRAQFKDYSEQLVLQYPSMKEDIRAKEQHIEALWNELETFVGCSNPATLLKDIELDISRYAVWLRGVEGRLDVLEKALRKDQSMQVKAAVGEVYEEIQCKSKWAPSIIHVCQGIITKSSSSSSSSSSSPSSPLTSSSSSPSSTFLFQEKVPQMMQCAEVLQHRWEAVYIRCLEWQLRSEGPSRNRRHDEEEDEEELDDGDDDDDDDTEGIEDESFYNGEMGELDEKDKALNKLKPMLPMIEEQTDEDASHEHLSYSSSDSSCQLSNPHMQSLDDDFFSHLRSDAGYSSSLKENHSSRSGLATSHATAFKDHLEDHHRHHDSHHPTNGASDVSDSSGIVATVSSNGRVGSASSAVASKEGSTGASKQSGSYGSSFPATEDEFSVDEVPVYKEVDVPGESKAASKRPEAERMYKKFTSKNAWMGSLSADEGRRGVGKHAGGDFEVVSDQEGRLVGLERPSGIVKGGGMVRTGGMMRGSACGRLDEVLKTPLKMPDRSPVKRNRMCLSSDNLSRRCEEEEEDGSWTFRKMRKVASCGGLLSRGGGKMDGREAWIDEVPMDDTSVDEIRRTAKARGSNQLVPSLMGEDTADDVSSFHSHSEVDLSDMDGESFSVRSSVDVWLEDNVWLHNGSLSHSTPKSWSKSRSCNMKSSRSSSLQHAPATNAHNGYHHQLPTTNHHQQPTTTTNHHNDFDFSDSDADDFQEVLAEFTKALLFTRQSVQQALHASAPSTDNVTQLLESLVTAQTSLRCLNQLMSAACNNTCKQFLDLPQLKALITEWTGLEAQVLRHEGDMLQKLIEEVMKTKKAIYRSQDVVKEVDVVMGGMSWHGEVSVVRQLIKVLHALQTEKKNMQQAKTTLQGMVVDSRITKIFNTVANNSTSNYNNNTSNTNNSNYNNNININNQDNGNRGAVGLYLSTYQHLCSIHQDTMQMCKHLLDSLNGSITSIVACLEPLVDFEKLLSHTHHGLSRLRGGPSGNANGDLNRPSKADSSGTYPVHEVDKSLEVQHQSVEEALTKMLSIYESLLADVTNAAADDDAHQVEGCEKNHNGCSACTTCTNTSTAASAAAATAAVRTTASQSSSSELKGAIGGGAKSSQKDGGLIRVVVMMGRKLAELREMYEKVKEGVRGEMKEEVNGKVEEEMNEVMEGEVARGLGGVLDGDLGHKSGLKKRKHNPLNGEATVPREGKEAVVDGRSPETEASVMGVEDKAGSSVKEGRSSLMTMLLKLGVPLSVVLMLLAWWYCGQSPCGPSDHWSVPLSIQLSYEDEKPAI